MALNYDSEAAFNLVKNIRELDCLYDVTLIAGLDGKKFSVHKIIMAASSRYFNVLFGPNFKEANQNEVVINEIDGRMLKTVIDYCYCCKIEINNENVDDIIAASSRMEFVQLAHQCENFWLSKLSIQNCLKALALADTHNLKSLWIDSLHVACENFDKLPEADLMQIDNRNLNSIFKEDMINAPEDVVAYRFAQWTLYDAANRKEFVTTLAKSIRLEHVSERVMKEVLEPFYKKYGCFGFVMAEYRKRSRNQMPIIPKRMSNTDKLYAVDTCYNDNAKDRIAIHELDDDSKTFKKLFEIPFRGDVDNVLFLNGKLFVFLCDTTKWHSLDLVTKKIESLTKTPFQNHSSPVIVGHYIYVFNEFELFRTRSENFARFDTKQKIWEYRKSLPLQFHDLTAVELNGLIYVAGELPAKNFYSSNFWCYDPNDDSWSEKQRINTIIMGGKHLIKVEKFICLINFNIDTIMIYDAESNQWNTELNVNAKTDNQIEQRIHQTTIFKGKTYGIVCVCNKYFGLVNLEATAKTCKVKLVSNASFNWIDVGLFVYKSIRDDSQ